MELKIKKQTKFVTPDQKEFTDKESALSYMRDQYIREQILCQMSKSNILVECLKENDTINNVVDFIIENKSFILNLFNETSKCEVEE